MAKRFTVKRLFLLMSAAGLIGSTQLASAAGFQLWEQDGASVGNYHAGRAAEAADASTAYYNPAGLIRIKNQQVVAGLDPILTNFKFQGQVTDTFLFTQPAQSVVAQGGGFNLIPFLHYAAPITDSVVFGMSVVVPFGLKTSYGDSTYVRYSALLSSLKVIDFTPSLGVALNQKLSLGAGLDIQHMTGQFNQTAGLQAPGTLAQGGFDTLSENQASDNALGFHVGALYQFSEQTRVGLSYFSQVVHHLKGNSKFQGPLANLTTDFGNFFQESRDLRVNITLPPIVTLSGFHTFNPTWDVMGTISYIQWDSFTHLTLQNVAGISAQTETTNSLVTTIPANYRNSWNYSVGANYHATDKLMIRGGLGYDQTPIKARYRNLQLPDSDRVAVALGGHYQATKTLGFDLGWTHLFAKEAKVNNSQIVGPSTIIDVGTVNASADVYGLQVKWDIV